MSFDQMTMAYNVRNWIVDDEMAKQPERKISLLNALLAQKYQEQMDEVEAWSKWKGS